MSAISYALLGIERRSSLASKNVTVVPVIRRVVLRPRTTGFSDSPGRAGKQSERRAGNRLDPIRSSVGF